MKALFQRFSASPLMKTLAKSRNVGFNAIRTHDCAVLLYQFIPYEISYILKATLFTTNEIKLNSQLTKLLTGVKVGTGESLLQVPSEPGHHFKPLKQLLEPGRDMSRNADKIHGTFAIFLFASKLLPTYTVL